jgi:ferredoxin
VIADLGEQEHVEALPFDLLRVPGVGRFLKWRHSRTVLQVPVLLVSVAMILHGLLGSSIAPKNLATVLSWVHFRGVLILVLLCAGNFFCMACPFMLVRNAARRVFRPRWNFPRWLRNKWASVGLFAGILFCYELFGLWSSPWLTAWVIVGYFGLALGVDGLFKHASFCKFVCPIGQFNFIASTVSPLEVKVRELAVCGTCGTKDCIKGALGPSNAGEPKNELVVLQRGCELALFQPAKVGNLDCTFCLDCVHACPHDNVGIIARMPTEELSVDGVRALRSGVGRLSQRKDLAGLSVIFTFGAVMNAFGMVSPIYALESWLGRVLHVGSAGTVLGLIFGAVLVVEPLVLLGAAAWATRRVVAGSRGWLATVVRYSYALVPMGFGMWLAHYSFHFLTGVLTIVPVVQSAAADVGLSLGAPLWGWLGMPVGLVKPIEFGALLLGCAGSMLVAWSLAEEDSAERTFGAFAPWALVCLLLLAASLWMMALPMDMRATLMAG